MLQLCSTLSWSLEMEVDIVDLGAKHVLFLKMFDFVVDDTTEDLHDREGSLFIIFLKGLYDDSSIGTQCCENVSFRSGNSCSPQGHCCIASLGFESVATLFDVVMVARNGGGHCRSRSKMDFSKKGLIS